MKLNHDDPIKIEQEIDAALKLLSETQPPAAMISRIHRNLEAAGTASEPTYRGWSLWIPAIGVAVAAILLVVYSQAHWIQQKRMPAVETAKMVTTTDSVLPDRAIAPSAPVPAVSRQRKELVSVRRDRHRRNRTQYRHVANLLSYPLTEQEKLLVRFAQTASPTDLQALNPEYQAKIEAQQEAEFVAYVKSRGISSTKETTN